MKRLARLVFWFACAAFAMCGCASPAGSGPANPVTLTLWHTYVEQMKSGMDDLVLDFNQSVGAKYGITVNVTSVANASVLNQKLMMAVNGDPGAPALPDMAVVYPQVALPIAEKGMLMDLRTQFTDAELKAYVPRFLEEGRLVGDAYALLPIAKSTEVLYVNRTIFDRFSAETGVPLSQLSTFEGIVEAAKAYYTWTDEKTPDVPGDGRAFYYPDNLFNFALIGYEQMGEHFIQEGVLNLHAPVFQRVWDSYFPPAVQGGVAIFDDYGNYLAKTGDIVCTTSTSAGVVYYPDAITYQDNTKEAVEFAVLPYPVFQGGRKVALQRGGGMCVFSSNKQKEYAAGVFLKWLTAPEQNLRFTASTGYLPVTQKAFDMLMEQGAKDVSDPRIRTLLSAVIGMQSGYDFYAPALFEGSEELQKRYAADLRKAAEEARERYLQLLPAAGAQAAYDQASRGAQEAFQQK